MNFNKRSAAAEDYRIKSERLCIPFSIVHQATPALKSNSNDLSDVMVLDLEGQLAASAIDAGCAFTSPADSTGVFGILLHNLGSVSKLHKFEVIEPSSGSVAVTRKGASSSGVTASGNIALSVDWDGSLASTDLSAILCVDYIISKA